MRLKIWALVLALCGFCFSRIGYGQQNPVVDPDGLLPQVRAFVGSVPFSSAFHCGDAASFTFFVFSCTNVFGPDGSVEQECSDSSTPAGQLGNETVYNCASDSVSILTDVTGSSVDVSASAYGSASGDMGEIFLAQAAEYSGYPGATVTLTSLQSTTYTLGRGTPQQRTVPAMNVIGTLAAPGEASFDLLITMISAAPGVAEMARFRLNNTTWFMLNDFTGASR